MNCDCHLLINAKLKAKGLKLSDKLCAFAVDKKTLRLELVLVWPLERIDGKRLGCKDPKTVRMACCPFCGKQGSSPSEESESER